MPLFLKQNETPDPIEIGLLGPKTIMFSPDHIADLIEEFGLAWGNWDRYGGGHAPDPPSRDPQRKRIIRPNYPPFPKKLPNDSAYFSLDRMRALSVSWPKLVGTLLLLQSAGFILLQGDFWWYRLGPDQGPMAAWEFWRLVVALLFPLLSYCVYRGHDWARLTVIALGFCLAAVILWRISEAVIHYAGVHDESTSTRSFGLWQLAEIADSLGAGLSQFLAPLAFIVCVLCHRDVAAAFHSATIERSNQTMQRTPTGSSPSTSND